ncbi:P-loop containing nucleoside triphosphate hydrolase protein [Saccharata proteae CBS 121410]|uniref:RNA helicase n=1 Tax=Saccharata proteae CBS 121410 TaxID=1314787 RepID=A0A9P4HYB1_9PEZI|nr:P-loop containing nucleoside triphosphate hydrolase protein [Saccharata proteae CBS 121410]
MSDTTEPTAAAAAPGLESRISGEPAPATATETGDVEQTPADGTVEQAQNDGAAPGQAGSSSLQEPEYDVEVKLADLQADPNNPLYSAKSFEELNLEPGILQGLYDMNFQKPSKIQEKALPLLLANPPQNLIGQSQSGTGKTAAFCLNILSRIDKTTATPQAIVLAPSRELARQIIGVMEELGKHIPELKVAAAIPDPNRRGTPPRYTGQVVVGTPGTVLDHIRKKAIPTQGIKILVLDEADNMIDLQGMGDQCKRVKQMLPKTTQIVLFSATFPDHVVSYAKQFAPNQNQITLKHDELTVEGIKQFYLDCEGTDDKYRVLLQFYGLMTIASSIIFCRTRATAADLQRSMAAEGHATVLLSGELDGNQRDEVIDAFRTGKAKVLITTNVLARGIDVQSVTMVINYDIPVTGNGEPDPETYLHRIGRTGRFGRVGVSISFIHDKDSWNALSAISAYFDTELLPLDAKDMDSVEEIIKKTIKSNRAGKSTEEMNS